MEVIIQKCAQCAEEIPLDATTCEYCGAQFEVIRSGYCQNCHQLRDVDAAGKCKVCGSETLDWHIESKLKGEPAPLPVSLTQEPEAPAPVVPPAGEASELLIVPIKGEGVSLRWSSVFLDAILISLIYAAVLLLYFFLTIPRLTSMSQSSIDAFVSDYDAILLLLIPLIWCLYFFILEGAFGTTPGKASNHLRVVKKGGGKISWGQAAVRALLSPFEDNPIGAIVIWSTPLKQRIGDLLAGTLVVHRDKVHKVEFRPPAITFFFHDYRRVEFAQITQGILYKFGMLRQLSLWGRSVDGGPLSLTLFGHFFRPEFDLLRLNFERRYGLRFPEKIILRRLVLLIFLLLILLGIALSALMMAGVIPSPSFLHVEGVRAPEGSLPAALAPATSQPSSAPIPTRTLPPTPTERPLPTPTPMPVEVTFDTIGNYPIGSPVILVGRLVLMSKIRCRDNKCGLLLENPANTSQTITIFITAGDEPNQLKPVPETYTKGDIRVRLDDGSYALVGYRIRVTGSVCSTTSDEPCISDITKVELYQVK
jgi:uncharacterized RDD family membrane protein YckC